MWSTFSMSMPLSRPSILPPPDPEASAAASNRQFSLRHTTSEIREYMYIHTDGPIHPYTHTALTLRELSHSLFLATLYIYISWSSWTVVEWTIWEDASHLTWLSQFERRISVGGQRHSVIYIFALRFMRFFFWHESFFLFTFSIAHIRYALPATHQNPHHTLVYPHSTLCTYTSKNSIRSYCISLAGWIHHTHTHTHTNTCISLYIRRKMGVTAVREILEFRRATHWEQPGFYMYEEDHWFVCIQRYICIYIICLFTKTYITRSNYI